VALPSTRTKTARIKFVISSPSKNTAVVSRSSEINPCMSRLSHSIGSGPTAILTKAAAGTGNLVTAERLLEFLTFFGHRQCTIVEESQFATQTDFSTWLQESNVVFVLGIHAYRAGRLLSDCNVPFGIILGGTDVNVDMQTPSTKRDVCFRALLQALFIVAFSEEIAEQLRSLFSAHLSSNMAVESVFQKVSVIRQSVSIPMEHAQGTYAFPSIHDYIGLSQSVKVILLPAALRPIKDPLFLLDALRLHNATCKTSLRFCLVIAGPSLDENTLHLVQAACMNHPEECKYVGFKPRELILHWMSSSFCVANTSESEGMSGTILEAMAVGCPVIARRNTGNCSLVQHGTNGFTFSSASEAVQICIQMIHEGLALRARICSAAAETIARSHSRESELLAFVGLFRKYNL
jgi:glycosyltransferase involved in cell wall biosynthesis